MALQSGQMGKRARGQKGTFAHCLGFYVGNFTFLLKKIAVPPTPKKKFYGRRGYFPLLFAHIIFFLF
jgi:hypothetical protein